jgi:hypothetical protein
MNDSAAKLRGIKNGYPILERSKLRGTDPKGRLEVLTASQYNVCNTCNDNQFKLVDY